LKNTFVFGLKAITFPTYLKQRSVIDTASNTNDKHKGNRTKKIDINKDEAKEWWVYKESENLMDR
jgi:hypothetical protein